MSPQAIPSQSSLDSVEALLYEAESISQFLALALSHLQEKHPKFGLRAWAKRLKLKGHSNLSMILQGKRPVAEPLRSVIAKDLKLSIHGKKYLDALALLASCQSESEETLVRGLLASLRPTDHIPKHQLKEDLLSAMSGWVHAALLELVRRTDVSPTTPELSKTLEGSFSAAEVHQALKRLERIGLLRQQANGSWSRKNEFLHTSNDVPSHAIRNFHLSMLEKASSAVEQQSVHERELQGLMLSIDSKDFPKLQQHIRQFYEQLRPLLRGSVRDLTVHIQTQAFMVVGPSKAELRVRMKQKPQQNLATTKGKNT